MRVLVLNGVNLGRLGERDPEVYGRATHAELAAHLVAFGATLGLEVEVRQSDILAEMLAWLAEDVGVVINPGAWTHFSRALGEAVAARTAPTIEVHISDVFAREPHRARSVVRPHATATIVGRGLAGYDDALRLLACG